MDMVKSKLGMTKSEDDKDQLIIENRDKLIKDKLIKDLQVTLEMGILGSLKHKVVKIYDFKGSLWLLLTISSLIDVFVTASKMEKTFHGLMLHTFHSIIVVLCFLHLIIHDKHNDYNKLSNKILNWIDTLLIAVYTLSAGIYLSTGFFALFGDISTTITDTETNNSTTVRLVDYLDAAQVDKDDPLKSLVVLIFKVIYSVKFLSREFTYKIFFILLRNYFIRALPSYGDEIVLDSNNNDRSCCKKCWSGFVNGLFMGMLAAILYLLMRQYPDTQIDFFVSLVTIYLVYLYVYLYHGVEQNEPNCSFIFGGHQAAAILYFMARFF